MSYVWVFLILMSALFIIGQARGNYYDGLSVIYHLLISVVLLWPTHWFVMTAMEQSKDREHQQRQVGIQFINRMQAQGCKIGDYVGTKSSITAVWKCPDGSAHLEPSEAEMIRKGR